MHEVDILEPSDRRRVRSSHEKAALLAGIDAEGGKVRLVARRQNFSKSLLCKWQSARRAAAVAMGASENVEFIPAGIIEGPASRAISIVVPAAPEREPDSALPSARGADKTGAIEISLPNSKRLAVDASVNEKVLALVLHAMKGQTLSPWRHNGWRMTILPGRWFRVAW